MGEGEEVKTREESNMEVKERGEIFMFYRPKVNTEEAESEEDVQRLYIVLRPESLMYGEHHQVKLKQDEDEDEEDDDDGRGKRSGGHAGGEEAKTEKEGSLLMRLIVMGQKSLPSASHDDHSAGGKISRPHWGFVELVTNDVGAIKKALQAEQYETSTRGHRHKPAARAMGEGVYRLLNHTSGSGSGSSSSRVHTHLVYKLQLPPKKTHGDDDGPSSVLNVKPEASFIIQVKNPESTNSRFGGLQKKLKASRFPAALQGLFGKRRFIPADPPEFLNYEGCELLLIPASHDIQGELGLQLNTHLDRLRRNPPHQHADSSSDEDQDEEAAKCSSFVHTFGEDSGLPTAPLFHGTWA